VKQRAAKGEAEAHFSHGCQLVVAADGAAGTTTGTTMGATGRSPKAVGLALCTVKFPVSH